MIYLLDVSALLALGCANHEFHARFTAWLDRLAKDGLPEFATCSITELGFVRILSQTGHYGIHIPVEEARRLLLRLKSSRELHWTSISDRNDISQLPRAKYARQVTDAHLAQLAKSNGAVLATLDRRIPWRTVDSLVFPPSRFE